MVSAHLIVDVMSILAPKRGRESNLIYELTFTEENLDEVNISYNDALVLMVNICKFDVSRELINPDSS